MRYLITGGSGFIGTHLIDALQQRQCAVFNVDRQRPKKDSHLSYWKACDILDSSTLQDIVRSVAPTHLVHLAARTDTSGQSLSDYHDNTLGTANVLKAIQESRTISRTIITSTQFVCGPGNLPKHDEDFSPHTVYGESKVISEQSVRQARLPTPWTIIRPTNIWGPWHPRYPNEFWRILKKGLYFHPGRQPVIRSYGYVGNVVSQVLNILEAPHQLIDKKVFYVGDMPINLYDWANAFSLALTGREVHVVPRGLIYTLAIMGDLFRAIGLTFPISTSRFQSMTQPYLTPMEPTLETLGEGPYSLRQGIDETIKWLRTQSLFWVR